VKPLRFLGDSLKRLREFPQPDDFKPMPAIGKGVEELRIWD